MPFKVIKHSLKDTSLNLASLTFKEVFKASFKEGAFVKFEK